MNVPPEIFKMYDIRGVYNKDLNDDTVETIGKGIGSFFLRHGIKKIIIGRDNRVSGPAIRNTLVKSLLGTGADVLDFGIILNPFVYYSWYKLNADGCVIITASHNPAQYNGFKISMKKRPLLGGDYQEILKICQEGKFAKGTSKLEEYNIWPEYKEEIKKNIKLGKKLKVAIDCGNGTAGLFAPEILKDLGCGVISLYTESDGSFPNHDPYPQKVELYQKLVKTIQEKKADLGLAFDGDGDRLGVYDEKGNFVENDRLAMIFSEDICRKNVNKKIVMNISTSLAVIDHIKSLGGDFYLWKTGYPYISDKMNKIGAIFGAEISGHFFFKDKYFGFDDALYAGIRILEILSKKDETFSQMVSKLPRYFETREFRVEAPTEKDKSAIVDMVKKEIMSEYPEAEIMDFDGIRFSFSDGWGLIRASNTEPLITGRAEARTGARLEQIKKIIQSELSKHGVNLDWSKV